MTRMISSWSFVFLLFIGVSFFAKVGIELSRVWLAAAYFLGLVALISPRLLSARWCGSGPGKAG